MKWFVRFMSVIVVVMLLVGVVRVFYYQSKPLTFEGLLARIESSQSKIDNDFVVKVDILGNTQKWLSLVNSKISIWQNQSYADMLQSGSIWDIVKYGFSYIVGFIPKLVTGLVTGFQFLIDGATTLFNSIISLFKIFYYIFFDI